MAGMLEYKCPCCDGAIKFDSTTQKMKCPYCDTEFEVDALKGYDEDLKDQKPSEMNWATPGGSWAEGETAGAPAPQATQSATNGQNAQGGQSTNQQQRTAPQPQNSAQTGGAACPVCGGPISEAERRYSMNKFGREMCRACQKNA